MKGRAVVVSFAFPLIAKAILTTFYGNHSSHGIKTPYPCTSWSAQTMAATKTRKIIFCKITNESAALQKLSYSWSHFRFNSQGKKIRTI